MIAALLLLAAAPISALPSMISPQEVSPWPAESIAASSAIKARKKELNAVPVERACLGADAVTCIASMSFFVYISSLPPDFGGYGELKLPTKPVRDIHGAIIGQSVTFLVQFVPGQTAIGDRDTFTASLYLADGVHVSKVDFNLHKAPIAAKTEPEWAATRVFELATATMGIACIGSDRLAFYRFYDDNQRSAHSDDDFNGSYSDPTVSSGVFGHATKCGARMEMVASSGISADIGSYSGSSLSFSTIGPNPAKPMLRRSLPLGD